MKNLICKNKEEAAEDLIDFLQGHSVNFSGKRLLLVEDNAMNREIAERILEEQGFVVETAFDGREAVGKFRTVIESAAEDHYAAIIMDIRMPEMDGIEATKAIRTLEPEETHVPIIALTADVSDERRSKCFAAGMDDYLTKPIDIPLLLATLAKYI